MKKTPVFLTALLALAACSTQAVKSNAPMLGGDRDAHNCIPSAGQTWSQLKQDCVQVFNVADLRLADPDNDTLAIYVILSADKQQAEVFKASFERSQIFDVVKGGYVSQDGSMSVDKTAKGWVFKRQ